MRQFNSWFLMIAITTMGIGLFGCQQEPVVNSITGFTMGTSYHVKWIGVSSPEQIQSLKQGVEETLERVNRRMSTYDPESEVSRFNQHLDLSPFTVSDETALVVKEALRLAQLSQGALDITVAPLVNLWGFGPDHRPEKIPDEAQLAAIAPYVGYQKLTVNGTTLQKQHPKLSIDLSSIAKGYGVDEVAEYLQTQHIRDFMVEVGGEMRLQGHKIENQPWVVGVEDPSTVERSALVPIVVGDHAIATSGDYRNYYEQDGQRFSHTIDPTTEKPINHSLASVTVIHTSCMTADGLATALMVMGTEKALAFAKQQNLAVYLISREGNGFSIAMTEQFKPFLQQE